MKTGDYVKRFIEFRSKGDPHYEFGRLRLAEGHDRDGAVWLVYWFETGFVDAAGQRRWNLTRHNEHELISSSEQEYFKHCLRYGGDD